MTSHSAFRRIRQGALRPSGLLLEAHSALGKAIDRHAVSTLELSPDVADLLVRLALAPDHCLRGVDISRQLLINPSRASRLIDRAEGSGMVVRQADPNDRRAQRITLTDRGREAAERFLPRLLGVLDRTIYEALTAEELEVLAGLLKRVRDVSRAVAREPVRSVADPAAVSRPSS